MWVNNFFQIEVQVKLTIYFFIDIAWNDVISFMLWRITSSLVFGKNFFQIKKLQGICKKTFTIR